MPLDPLFTDVEQTLADDLNVDSLAEAELLSRSQLYRAFYSTAGHSVKEYIRKRRLSAALTLIKHTDLPLAQIAQAFFCSELVPAFRRELFCSMVTKYHVRNR